MGGAREHMGVFGGRISAPLDHSVPVVLLVASLWEIWVGTLFSPGVPGPRGLETLAALVYSLPLLARRRAPLAVLFLVLVGNAAQVPYVHGSDQTGLEGFLALLLAVYSVGAHAPSARGFVAVCAATSAIAIGDALRGGGAVGADAGLYVLLPALWLFGDVLRRHRSRNIELQAETGELERRRLEAAEAAVADERARIARELHDVVAHSLSVMVVQIGAARQVLTSEPHVATRQLVSAETTGRQALAEMRRLLGIVKTGSSLALAPQPSLGHVDLLVEQVRKAGLDVQLCVEGDPRPLAPGVDLSAYRIVQEALTNTVKHAGPARADVVVRYGRDNVELEVSDNGRGAPQNGASGGHGLVGMRERVALYGGAFSAGPQGSGGFCVRARLPLDGGAP